MCRDKTADDAPSKPSWSPSHAELEEGVLISNAQAPECDAQNEQTLDPHKHQLRLRHPDCQLARAKGSAHVPEQKSRTSGSRKHDRVPFDYLQPQSRLTLSPLASPLPLDAQLWRVVAGVSRSWQDSLL